MQSTTQLYDGYALDTAETQQTSILSLMTAIGQGKAPYQSNDVIVPAPRPFATNAEAEQFLRQNGILDATNPTNANAGIYVSDTKQIHLNSTEGMLKVVTSHTEALAYSEIANPVTLGALTINYASSDGLFAVSSLDGLSVADSPRLLVIYATDAQNSGITFTDATETTVTNYGELPVVIRVDHIGGSLPSCLMVQY